jgi:hypothetical protein
MSCIVGCHGSVSDKVAENFPLFMDYFLGSGLDYHIGVVTADLDSPQANGRLQYGLGEKFIDTNTPAPMDAFFDMAAQGTDGGGVERGLGATYKAIELLGDSVNSGFYRDTAALHTIVLSDEEDQTQGSLITQDEFVDWYDELKQNNEERTFNAIVCHNQGEACPSGRASKYINTANEIGGIVWDIERDDWAALLDQLGAQAAGLKREYYLSQLPVPDTITVKVHETNGATLEFFEASGDPLEGDWTYDEVRNSITFLEYVPGAGARVVIDYTVASAILEQE